MFAKRAQWSLTPNRFTKTLESLRSAGSPLLDLTVSNPTECGLEFDEAAILAAFQDPALLRYVPSAQGSSSAREAVAGYYREKKIWTPPEDVFLTTSTSEAYSYVFRLICDPGDEVLVPRPSYPLFEFLADIQDVRLRPYSLVYDHGWQIDLHSLESAVTPSTRAVLLVHPNNPTGSFVHDQERSRLNEICAARGLALICDEVFHDFSLVDSAASFAGNSHALTFVLSGLSKVCGLPQMKAAWCVVSGPESMKREAMARLEIIADTYLSMSAPIQSALPQLLGLRESFQKRLGARLRANLAELDQLLARQGACHRLEVEGGWYVVLRVPVTGTDEDLAISLMQEENVILHPGHFFDFESEGHLVLSLMTAEADFHSGCARILHRIESLSHL